MTPRILQIHLRRWLHDRKLHDIKNDNKLPTLKNKKWCKKPEKRK